MKIHNFHKFNEERGGIGSWAIAALMSLGLSKVSAQNVNLDDTAKVSVVKTLCEYNENPTSPEALKTQLSPYVKNVDKFIECSTDLGINNTIRLKPGFGRNLELFIQPYQSTVGVSFPIRK